jgi:hypothetical protein
MLLGVLFVSIDASQVVAEIVKYSVSGTIAQNQDNTLYPGISSGDPFSGFFAYDDSIVGVMHPKLPQYQFDHAPSFLGVSITVGGQTFQGDSGEGYAPQLYDDFFGMDSIVYRQPAVPLSGYESTDFIVHAEFVGPTTVISIMGGDAVHLPTTMNLADWTTKAEVKFGVNTLTGVEQYLSGTINLMELMVATDADGDYNLDGFVNEADINLQSAAMNEPSPDVMLYDENDDGVVDYDDRVIMLHDHVFTWVGDANLDGEFDSGDLVIVFDAGKYDMGEMATWSEGDWDGNMLFDSGDLVVAFADSGYDAGPRPAPVPVPEPSAMTLCLVCATACLVWWQRFGGGLD